MKIVNYAVTADLNCELDLNHIAKNVKRVEYRPKVFNGLKLTLSTSAVGLLFKTSKIVCVGAKSLDQAKQSVKLIEKKMLKLGYNAKLSSLKITNIVGTGDFGFKVDLNQLRNLPNTSYEPEIFPAAIITIPEFPKIKASIFWSGKVNVYGATTEEKINEFYDNLSKIVFHFLIK
jgi:transcription initiation factor TFIID TATA-box-binding protein